MQKQDIKITLVLSAIALLVLISLQIKWTLDAFTLTEKQFEHRVTMALNEVIDKVARSTELYRGCTNTTCAHYNVHVSNMEQVINFHYLDSIFHVSFDNYKLGDNYRYKLFNASKRDCPSVAIFSHSIYLRPHDECSSWKADEYQLGVFFPEMTKHIVKDMLGGILISTLLILFVVFAIYYIVSTLLRQKRLSEVKNDFINNMTHEFKTPLATISLAAEVLQKSAPFDSHQRIMKYSNIIQEENNRLRTQVDYILKMATLQKKEFNLQLTEVNVNAHIRETIDHMCLGSHEKTIQVFFELEAPNHHAFVDKLHFTNMIINLVNNAVKYSGPIVNILVSTHNACGKLNISVQDDGIGITKDHQKHIFEKFFRVPSGDVHDVKGFGLGLFYVKEMVVAHKGTISVESEPGNGTVFCISIPYVNNN